MAAASASTVAESRQRHVQSAGTSVAASTSGHWNPLENGADALRLLQHRSTKSGSFAILNHLNQLCGKDWTIAFSKVDRHNNEVADRLAKLASVATFDVVTFDEPPSEVIPELNLVL
ncbi:hypothetical protein V6N11_018835 [Hibiscus sabdariffa]|uniref:RNase H type-1 domain-containing protein n=1 Tax=Hibiscus sabdariffa TaxID=183260 RepID=A0ABR2N8I9_9ROSI